MNLAVDLSLYHLSWNDTENSTNGGIPWPLAESADGLGMNYPRTTPSTNSLDEVPRPPAAPRDRPRGFLVLASSADALENCELTVTFEALEKPEILEIVDRGMVVNLTLSTQILN